MDRVTNFEYTRAIILNIKWKLAARESNETLYILFNQLTLVMLNKLRCHAYILFPASTHTLGFEQKSEQCITL